MAYDERLADRIRQVLAEKGVDAEEKKMFGGIAFMVDDKMCVGVVKEEVMARVGPEKHEEALKAEGARTMDFTKRPMKGFVFVQPEGVDQDDQLEMWVQWCLDYNPLAKASKKRKRNK